MKDKIKLRLVEFHNTLEKEHKELEDIREELIKLQLFGLAKIVHLTDGNIHRLQHNVCCKIVELAGEIDNTDYSHLTGNLD